MKWRPYTKFWPVTLIDGRRSRFNQELETCCSHGKCHYRKPEHTDGWHFVVLSSRVPLVNGGISECGETLECCSYSDSSIPLGVPHSKGGRCYRRPLNGIAVTDDLSNLPWKVYHGPLSIRPLIDKTWSTGHEDLERVSTMCSEALEHACRDKDGFCYRRIKPKITQEKGMATVSTDKRFAVINRADQFVAGPYDSREEAVKWAEGAARLDKTYYVIELVTMVSVALPVKITDYQEKARDH